MVVLLLLLSRSCGFAHIFIVIAAIRSEIPPHSLLGDRHPPQTLFTHDRVLSLASIFPRGEGEVSLKDSPRPGDQIPYADLGVSCFGA